jgi:hypothetical protein
MVGTVKCDHLTFREEYILAHSNLRVGAVGRGHTAEESEADCRLHSTVVRRIAAQYVQSEK